MLAQDLVDDLLWAADEQSAFIGGGGLVGAVGKDLSATALMEVLLHAPGEVRVGEFLGLLGGRGDETGAVDADPQLGRINAQALTGGPVEIDHPLEAVEATPQDPQGHRQSEFRGADRRGRCATHRYPGGYVVLDGAWGDISLIQRGRSMPCQVIGFSRWI